MAKINVIIHVILLQTVKKWITVIRNVLYASKGITCLKITPLVYKTLNNIAKII